MNAIDYAEKASEVFVLSDSFVRIKELIDDEASTIDDIANVILLDPALAGSVLKLANSSFFNYPGKINTISKAVLVLGITEVYNLVVAYLATKALRPSGCDEEFLANFWENSIDCALNIKFLGYQLKVKNSERLFILGLLHNIGELVVHQFVPDKVRQCQVSIEGELPWHKQKDILGFTFADCAGELLKLWQLPYSLIEPIREQDQGDFRYSTIDTQLLFVAKRMTMVNRQQILLSNTDLTEEKLSALHIREELFDAANNFCDIERLSILAMLKPSAAMVY